MTTPRDVLEIARADIGYMEAPPGSNRTKFGDWYGVTGPWCAMYVSHAFFTAGLPLEAASAKGFCYCPDGFQWFQQKGWLSSAPKVGDVVFYHFAGSHPGANHVGIVEAVDPGVLTTLEGNTGESEFNGGAVQRRKRPLGPAQIGFGRPPYELDGATTAPPAFPGRLMALTSPYTRGDDVLDVQKQLVRLGIGGADGSPIAADGVLGPNTRAAVLNFQRAAGLTADGVVGPATWRRLWKATPA